MKDPTADEIGGRAEKILNGEFGGWDVDNYESMNPRDLPVRGFWIETMKVGGVPEKWVQLDEEKKSELRNILKNLREIGGRKA